MTTRPGDGPLRVGQTLERLVTGRAGVPDRCAPAAERRGDMPFGTASPTPPPTKSGISPLGSSSAVTSGA